VKASQLLEPNINWQEAGPYADGISTGTWRRFLSGQECIREPAFKAYCQVLGLNWQDIAKLKPNGEEPDTFYIERPPIESQCYEAILQPGALIRIKAPQQMGKTSLIRKVLEQARKQGYQTPILSFDELADSTVFTDLRAFLRCFCVSIGDSLELPNRLNDYWDDIRGPNNNTTSYFQKYLLANITSPAVLALDKVDRVFEHPSIANDFCCLLRGWYDKARSGDRSSPTWQNLRLVLVHSTELYGELDINHSPLANVGLAVELPEFSLSQVRELVQRHKLDWNDDQVDRLMSMVGGHPYLVEKALDHIERHRVTLEELLQAAPTEAGPLSDHLLRHLETFQKHPSLAAAFSQVVTATASVKIEPFQAFKLYSMGLVNRQENSVMPRCDLYRRYFGDRLN
jgi:hypothetical protein